MDAGDRLGDRGGRASGFPCRFHGPDKMGVPLAEPSAKRLFGLGTNFLKPGQTIQSDASVLAYLDYLSSMPRNFVLTLDSAQLSGTPLAQSLNTISRSLGHGTSSTAKIGMKGKHRFLNGGTCHGPAYDIGIIEKLGILRDNSNSGPNSRRARPQTV